MTVLLWPKAENDETVEENAEQQEILSTAKAINRSANNLNNVLLKTRAGVISDSKMFKIVAEELKSHRETLQYIIKQPNLKADESIIKQAEQISGKVDQKFDLAMQFSQHHAQHRNSIKRARDLGERVAEIIVNSANIDAIAMLDLTYKLGESLNNWVNFNQQSDGDFILQNVKKLQRLSNYVEAKKFKVIDAYGKSLEASVREQKKANQLLDKAIAVRAINIARFERNLMMDVNSEEEKTKEYSATSIIVILFLAIITNILLTVLLVSHIKQWQRERMFLRDKTATLLKRSRANVQRIGNRVQGTADGYKHYQKLNEISKKVASLWRSRNKEEDSDELISSLLEDYRSTSQDVSDKAVQLALIECTTELDEFEQELHEIRQNKFKPNKTLYTIITQKMKEAKAHRRLKKRGHFAPVKKKDQEKDGFLTV